MAVLGHLWLLCCLLGIIRSLLWLFDRSNLVRFFGLVKKGLPHGLGLFVYPDLKYHSGYYVNGLLKGLSRIHFGNGDLYEGETNYGKMNGHGFFINAEMNEWVFGVFENDECIEVLEAGESGPPEAEICKKTKKWTN